MEVIDTILSAPVLFGLVVAASLVLVAKAVISLLDKAPPLRAQLDKVNKQLSSAHDGIPKKRTKVSGLQEELKTLKETTKRLQDYNTILMDVELQAKREEEDKRRQEEISIHRPETPEDL